MITSLKLALLHKIGQNMTNPSEASYSFTCFPFLRMRALQTWVSPWGGRAGSRKVPPALLPVLCRLGQWLHRPPDLPQHSWAKPKELWEAFLSLIEEYSPCKAPVGNTALSACNSSGSLTCSFLSLKLLFQKIIAVIHTRRYYQMANFLCLPLASF